MLLETNISIINKKGLHARASVKLVELAQTFDSSITLSNNTTSADGKNVLQLMMLAASKGTQLKLSSEGTDARAAQAAISKLINGGFDEEGIENS